MRRFLPIVLIAIALTGLTGAYWPQALVAFNNLSDLTSASTARGNLGLGTAATHSDGDYLHAASNLSDVAAAATARTNLGLGSMATQNASSVAITGGSISNISIPYQEITSSISQYGGVNNCALTESHVSNNVTFNLTDAAGATPTSTSPCIITGGGALNGGLPLQTVISSAKSVTLNSGSTLGIPSGTPFRVYLLEATDGTTDQLVAFVAANPASPTSGIAPIGPGATVACNACATATSIQTYYGPTATAGATLHRTIGYANYSSGLATAGQWNVSPDTIALMTPGTPTPGRSLGNVAYATNSTTTTVGTATPTATSLTCTLNMTAKQNFVRVQAWANISVSNAVGVITKAQLSRGSGPTLMGNEAHVDSSASGTPMEAPVTLSVLDAPQSSGSVSYTPYVWGSAAVANAFRWNPDAVVTNCVAEEIQG